MKGGERSIRILLIEDDQVIGERIQTALQKVGYPVTLRENGEEGLLEARIGDYGLIVLDLMLPGRDGWRVCEALRNERNPVPILMLTARDDIEDRVRGLEAGADDYLAKPFDFRELLARIRALIRRQSTNKSQVIQIADLEIDTTERIIRRNNEVVPLTPHEYSLLEALARNPGRTLSREYIQERIWGDEDSSSNVVSYHITLLRKKIDSDRKVKLIQTVYGFGYVLRIPEEDTDQ